jgi:hypothetical protein
MSVALGSDLQGATIQVGKALNDPIKGIAALQRVGVSFTAGQKKTIESLVDSGKTMEAQKLILKELNKEFGGSAKAFGKTMPGQIEKAKNSFAEMAATLLGTVAPGLAGAAEGAADLARDIQSWAQSASGARTLDQIGYAASQLGHVLVAAARGAADIVGAFGGMDGALLPVVGAIAGAVLGYKTYKLAVDAAKAATIAFNTATKASLVGLAVGAVMAIAGAFGAMKLKANESEDAIRANERAMRDLQDAILDTQELELAVDQADLTKIQAALDQRAAAAEEKRTRGTSEHAAAVMELRRANLSLRDSDIGKERATERYNDQLEKNKNKIKEMTTDLNHATTGVRTLTADLAHGGGPLGMYGNLTRRSGESVGHFAKRVKEARSNLNSWTNLAPQAIANARKLASQFDWLTGKTLEGGRGFAKMRDQMQQVNDKLHTLSDLTAKEFKIKIVTQYSQIGKGPGGLPTVNLTGNPIPHGATGGIVRRPTLALIGEAGPEAVVPLDRTAGNSPLPKDGFGGGTVVNVHFHGPAIGVDKQAIAKWVLDGIGSSSARQRAYTSRVSVAR